LIGKDAGREHAYRAELHFRSRREQLQQVKHAYTQFVAGLDKNQKKHISDFLRGGGLKELAADARGTVTLGLLDADLSPRMPAKPSRAWTADSRPWQGYRRLTSSMTT